MDLRDIRPYLEGNAFDNSLKITISTSEKNISYRQDTIIDIVKNKNIIHFGCADHVEIIEQKIEKNIWLHSNILNSALSCVGIDNNKEAIKFLTEKLNIPNVFCIDIEKEDLPLEITTNNFDFIVMGELVEHIDNPVQFLSNIREKFSGIVETIIITTPNAFRWKNFKLAMRRMERINSDHRFWFTPYTLAKILSRAGYKEIKFQFVENSKPEKFSLRQYLLYKYYPQFRDTLLMQASM